MNKTNGDHTQKFRTIRSEIMSGYWVLTTIMVLLIGVAVFALYTLSCQYDKITAYRAQQLKSQEVVTAHVKWLENLSEAITTGEAFTGSLNPNTCTLGKWIEESEEEFVSDPVMYQALESIVGPHQDIHLTASELLEMSKADRDVAFALYRSEYKPKVELISEGLGKIGSRYQSISKDLITSMNRMSLLSYVLMTVAGVCAVILSLGTGRRVAARISRPISAVQRWSEELASGVENLHIDRRIKEDASSPAEIVHMIEAFERMADGIQADVGVIQKVAEGDLTAYVPINSQGDSLGRNLYHLVQNNDLMFAQMLQVADSVALSADSVTVASETLAESSSAQATSVEILSGAVKKANEIATYNAEGSIQATQVIGDMGQVVNTGRERMEALLQAVKEIRLASDQISTVLKSINDIAFQTNILALNAAVEAARAGNAGKGFAVVADEVRNLALKSSEAADNSRILIENTVAKTNEGSQMATQAADTFETIVSHSVQVSEIVSHINFTSLEQQQHMQEIHDQICKISSEVEENAASSEDLAKATQQMNINADNIRKAMLRFQLRKREPGKPYIPPEKMDDEEFIQMATKNYLLAQTKDVGAAPIPSRAQSS